MFDPSYVFVAPNGKRWSYAEWRKSLPADLAQQRHSQVKTTVKAVRGVDNGFVASIEWQHSYEVYDQKRSAWIPMILVATQEETWRSDSRGNWKTVLTKSLREKTSPVVVQSGDYHLTEQMLQTDLEWAQILAGADFSPSDAAALRAEDIAQFPKEPAQQTKDYKDEAEHMQQQAPPDISGKRSWGRMALLRDNEWQWLGQNPQAFRDFQNDTTVGRMVLKYNPVVVNPGGIIIT